MKNTYSIRLIGFLIIIITLAFAPLNAADEMDAKLLDSWDEGIRLFGVSNAKSNIDVDLRKRRDVNYYFHPAKQFQPPGFGYDSSDKVCGDFSIRYQPAMSKNASKFGFMTQIWDNWFALDDSFALKFRMKTEGSKLPEVWKMTMVDAKNRSAETELQGVDTHGKWKEFSIDLKSLIKAKNFDLSSIKLVQFEGGVFSEDTVIRFDRITFENGEKVYGVTDKSLSQRMTEAEATLEKRVDLAMQASAKGAPFALLHAFAKLYLNQDLDEANQLLFKGLEDAMKGTHWGLFEKAMMCRLYYHFSNRAGKFKNRMSPEAEKRLLEVLWDRTHVKNDIHWARSSIWYLDGSENHDLSGKSASLVSSRIFMNEPEYKDRIYPDHGYGGGYYYGHSGYLGRDAMESRHSSSGGRATLNDGKKYNAEDHYHAWISFFKKYFTSRAKHGFFVENFAHGYSKHTWNMIELIRSYGGDDTLKKQITDFADLYWASWAQAAPGGILGGPKTRHHGKVGGYCSNTDMIRSKLGGAASASVWYYWNILTDYQLPKVVWKMALDREGMGTFVYKSRGIGEEVGKLPRPAGTERSLVIEPNSRFLKYVYVTPQYTLGTQMEYPLAIHSHLSATGRWHGLTIAADPGARIVPVSLGVESKKSMQHSPKIGAINMEVIYKTVQHEDTLIFQRNENFTRIDPDWFPDKDRYNNTEQGVFVGHAWDHLKEDSGWVFVQKGDVYAGIRPLLRDVEYEVAQTLKKQGGKKVDFSLRAYDAPTVKIDDVCYTWNEDRSIMILTDDFAAVILQSGDKEKYGSFDDFMNKVKATGLELYKTVVPEFDEVVYNPPGNESEIVFNAANIEIPKINGEYINYEHPKTFDSPYIQSEYGSGKIRIAYDGEILDLDFTQY